MPGSGKAPVQWRCRAVGDPIDQGRGARPERQVSGGMPKPLLSRGCKNRARASSISLISKHTAGNLPMLEPC